MIHEQFECARLNLAFIHGQPSVYGSRNSYPILVFSLFTLNKTRPEKRKLFSAPWIVSTPVLLRIPPTPRGCVMYDSSEFPQRYMVVSCVTPEGIRACTRITK